MSLHIEEQVDLTPLNTLGITATAEYLVRIESVDQLPEAIEFAKTKHLPIIQWGDGSNVVIGQSHLKAIILRLDINGLTEVKTPNHVDITAQAGENWDAFVESTVRRGLRGIESLSLIPGTVGAAPVQNVGAYGQEVSETITAVEAYDIESAKVVTLSNADCRFSYRDSMFKHGGKGRYIITAVTFRLTSGQQAPPPEYITLQAELNKRGITNPSVADVRDAVIAIRRSKLPDPNEVPTVGSFFHLPRISAEQFQKLQADHPEIPHWPADGGKVKISAAWMVEQCGFKGKVENGVGVYEKQALCLINPGHRPASEVLAFRDKIIAAVEARFGVTLQMEPELISI